ncbi:hypothetical protein AB0J38_06950 [Streptomyces sp. NPDC050095]|uniref:hypothetical protein n=1 Tax=unclassified Streptomyces TaxID=2593676 RepID=UPI003443221D
MVYANAAFTVPTLIGASLLAEPVITSKPGCDIPDIAVVSESRPAVFDNSVQNHLGF